MFDAAFRAPSGQLYLFRGDVFWEYDGLNGGIQSARPRRMTEVFPGIPQNLDAAYRARGTRSDKVYFIKGRNYWRFHWGPTHASDGTLMSYGHLDAGYPKSIRGAFKDHWEHGFDAVVDTGDAVGEHLRFAFRRDQVREYMQKGDLLLEKFAPISDRFEGVLDNDSDHPREVCTAFAGEDTSRDRRFANNIYMLYFNRQKSRTAPVDLLAETICYAYDSKNPGSTRRFSLGGQSNWRKITSPLTAEREAAVHAFKTDTTPSAFQHLDRAVIADQMRHRLMEPMLVNQNSVGICGPASIVYWMIKTQPDLYIRLVRQMFNEGKFRGHGKQYNLSNQFLKSTSQMAPVGGTRIDDIDWMVMGALRDSVGALNMEGDGKDLTATRPRIMKEWLSEVLGYSKVGIDRSQIIGEHKALIKADAAYNAITEVSHPKSGRFQVGGVGILQVDSGLLQDAIKKRKKKTKSDEKLFKALGDRLIGNHYVVYEGDNASSPGQPLKPNDGFYTFDVYSWGQIFRVDVDEKTFRSKMFATIWGA